MSGEVGKGGVLYGHRNAIGAHGERDVETWRESWGREKGDGEREMGEKGRLKDGVRKSQKRRAWLLQDR